jgi:hypothetical protein
LDFNFYNKWIAIHTQKYCWFHGAFKFRICNDLFKYWFAYFGNMFIEPPMKTYVLINRSVKLFKVKTHYDHPLWGHIVLLSKDVHVWMYPTSNFWKIFTIFLHITLEYNLGKRLENKLFHSIIKWEIGIYLWKQV